MLELSLVDGQSHSMPHSDDRMGVACMFEARLVNYVAAASWPMTAPSVMHTWWSSGIAGGTLEKKVATVWIISSCEVVFSESDVGTIAILVGSGRKIK